MSDDPTKPGTSRRAFLRGSALAAGALAAGRASAAGPDPLITEVQPWAQVFGDGVDAVPYGLPIRFEDHVVRRNVEWLTADVTSSINFTPIHALEGTITPQGCAFERHHSGAIELSKPDYRLMVNGLVDRPLVFTYADLERFPRTVQTNFCECAANSGMEWGGAQLQGAQFTHGMIHNMEYIGVSLRTLLNEAGVKPEGTWVYFEGADASSNGRSIPMEKALDDCLVAFFANGEALRKEHGYPVRLVVPGWEGNLWVKWLRRIEVTDGPVEAREETSKYTDLMPDGRARKWTWEMDAKSVITSPSPAGALAAGAGTHGHHRARLDRPGQDRPCRRLARRRQELAGGAACGRTAADGADAVLARPCLGRLRDAAPVPRHRRDGLRPADQGRAARDPGAELGLSQQRNPDLVGQARRGG
jgi:sulfane dehydrogenase subunit SoxC